MEGQEKESLEELQTDFNEDIQIDNQNLEDVKQETTVNEPSSQPETQDANQSTTIRSTQSLSLIHSDELPQLPKKVTEIKEDELYTLGAPVRGGKDEFEEEEPEPIVEVFHQKKEYVGEVRNPQSNLNTSVRINQDPIGEDEEGEDEATILDPSHPLLSRVQGVIHNQLSKHMQKLELETREREEEASKEIKRREDAGVELYTLQQQLARLQALYEGSEENFAVIKGLREEAERSLKHAKTDYQKEQEKHANQQKNLEQHQQELEKISRTLKQVDLYNDELRSKILVAKRTTLKAEKDIIRQEIEKKRQDFFIDHLTEKMRKLQEKRATYDSQLLVQQRETHAAVQTLQDAATEMEAIQFEKRQLLNQWKSSLIGLKKRDDMLSGIENAIQKNNEALAIMNTEILGFKRTFRAAQEEGENLTGILNKLEYEMEYIKRQISGVGEQKDKLSETYSMFMKSLNQTEREMQSIQQERQSVQLEINAIQKAQMNNTQAIQKTETEIAEKLKLQASFQKGAQSFIRDGNKLRTIIHDKEVQASNHQNELAVIQLESMNCEQRINAMNGRLAQVNSVLDEKNALIGKYEQEMRQNNDLLSKKAAEIDALNKKYDQMTAGSEDSNMGPLEATIYNLTKSIQLKEHECLTLQQYWLRAQNELVAMSKKSLEITDEIQNLRMRLTVLNRKKMVVNSAFETEEKEIKEHNRNIRHLQNEMVKVNTILSKQSSLYDKLEESNLEMEQKFRNKLKDAELDSIHMETQLDQLKAEKEQALVGLIEAERQIMLWEKKIQLAKETQAALDPNVGATEIREMTLEIHRMTLRYASMLKLQEKMIAEMEKSVYRRESISTKGKAKGKGSGQLSLQKAIADLTKKIEQATRDVKECEHDIINLEQSQEMLKEQIKESYNSHVSLNEKVSGLEVEKVRHTCKKQMMNNFIQLYQKLHKRYQDLSTGKYQFVQTNADQRTLDISKQQSRLEKIQILIRNLQEVTGDKAKVSLEQVQWFTENASQEVLAL